jgi:hypothetical protein
MAYMAKEGVDWLVPTQESAAPRRDTHSKAAGRSRGDGQSSPLTDIIRRVSWRDGPFMQWLELPRTAADTNANGPEGPLRTLWVKA